MNKFYVGECRFGKGIFAKESIKKGAEILKFSGPLIDFKQTKLMGDRECAPLQIENNIYMLRRARQFS